MTGLEDYIMRAFEVSQSDKKPVLFKLAKGYEEGGELAEAVLFSQGFLPHKTMKEPLVGEVVDVILCALDVLRGTQDSTVSNEDLMVLLQEHLERKLNKWQSIVTKNGQ